jgi:hypothetical protein
MSKECGKEAEGDEETEEDGKAGEGKLEGPLPNVKLHKVGDEPMFLY